MAVAFVSSSSRSEIREFLEFVERELEELAPLDSKRENKVRLSFKTAAERVAELRTRYQEPFRLAFLGEFKAGKSALINAILGRPNLLPEGATPTTGTVTEVWWGCTEQGEVFDARGERIYTGSLEDAVAYADQRTTVGRRSGSGNRVVLCVHEDVLRDLVIIDTPGLGASEKDDLVTIGSLDLADAAVLVINGLRPGGEDSLRLSDLLRRAKRRLVAAVTRVDQCSLPDDSLKSVREVFGELIEGDPIGVSSPRIQEALGRLQQARDFDDREAIRSAQAALDEQGYVALHRALQDSLLGTGAHGREARTLNDLGRLLAQLVREAEEEAVLSHASSEGVKAELDAVLRQVHEILRPKRPYVEEKIREIVDQDIGKYVEDLREASEVFIEDLFEHPLGIGWDAALARFSKARKQKLTAELEARFKKLLPDSRAEITAEDITRAVTRLLQVEWGDIFSRLPPPAGLPGFVHDHERICDHMGQLAAAVAFDVLAVVGFLLAPGGALLEMVCWMAVQLGISGHIAQRQDPRLLKEKRKSALRIRNLRADLTHKLGKHFFEENIRIANSAEAPYTANAGEMERRRIDLLARAEGWRRATDELRRLERDLKREA